MNIILLGMPGAGKGTVSEWLQKERHFTHVSTGDLLREEVQSGTELGKKVENIMNEGKLVSDDLMIAIIENFIKQKTDDRGIIFDGFPRTNEQADSLDKIITIHKVVFLKVEKGVVMQRLLNRVDDGGGKRDDDSSDEIIRKRIEVYFQNTQPLIDYYKERGILHTVDGGDTIPEVCQAVDSVLSL